MDNILKALNAIHPISKELTGYLLNTIKIAEVKKGEYLLREGQVSRRANFVSQGLLRSFNIVEGEEFTVGFFKEGEVSISLASYESQTPSLEYVEALEDSVIYYLERQDLEYLFAHYPEAEKIGRKIFYNAAATYTAQLNKAKMLPALDRYKWFVKHHADLVLRVPAKYIASYLGLSESTLSRLKSSR